VSSGTPPVRDVNRPISDFCLFFLPFPSPFSRIEPLDCEVGHGPFSFPRRGGGVEPRSVRFIQVSNTPPVYSFPPSFSLLRSSVKRGLFQALFLPFVVLAPPTVELFCGLVGPDMILGALSLCMRSLPRMFSAPNSASRAAAFTIQHTAFPRLAPFLPERVRSSVFFYKCAFGLFLSARRFYTLLVFIFPYLHAEGR